MNKLLELRQSELKTLYSKNEFELIPLFALGSSVRIVVLVILIALIARA